MECENLLLRNVYRFDYLNQSVSEMIFNLGISRPTWQNMLNRPIGEIKLDQVAVLKKYGDFTIDICEHIERFKEVAG